MFKSFDAQPCGNDRYVVVVADTDFLEETPVHLKQTNYAFEEGVIQTYRKRNLPVVPNLYLAIVYAAKVYGRPRSVILQDLKRYSPYYLTYADELQKYLLLG